MDDRVTLMVVEKYPQSTLENRGNLIRGVNISFTGLLLKRNQPHQYKWTNQATQYTNNTTHYIGGYCQSKPPNIMVQQRYINIGMVLNFYIKKGTKAITPCFIISLYTNELCNFLCSV